VVPDSTGTPPTAYEGNFKARVRGYGSHYVSYYSTLVTPVFDLSNLSSPVVLSFRHVGSRGDYLMVGYKDYPDGTWIPLQSFGDTIYDWKHQEIMLYPYTSNYIQFGFHVTTGTFSDSGEVQLDDIKIMDRSQYVDATLSNLSISTGELNPEFSGNIRNYTINVVDGEEITITATPTNPYATVSGVGTFLLEAGQNSFTVNVIAADGATKLDYEIVVNNLVGVTEAETSLTTIYPNPTTGELKIENGELRIRSVEVFDVYGRKLLTENCQLKTTIDISHLNSGIYFVKITTEAGIQTQKVIKH